MCRVWTREQDENDNRTGMEFENRNMRYDSINRTAMATDEPRGNAWAKPC